MFHAIWLLLLAALYCVSTQEVALCPHIPVEECCRTRWSPECVPKHCFHYVMLHCPDRKTLVFRRTMKAKADIRRAPISKNENELLPKCGTAQSNYEPCTSKTIANKLFLSCCKLYVPSECHSMCIYETDQKKARKMVGSRCLRMCDPSGIAIERLKKEDATCLFNWNVIMYCHHSGIREM